MSFLTLGSADIRFAERKLVWRTYSAAEALPTTRRVEIIDKKEFAVVALNENDETFVMHTATISTDSNIHPSWRTHVTSLDVEEVAIPPSNTLTIPTSLYRTLHTGIDNHTIDLVDDKQPPYNLQSCPPALRCCSSVRKTVAFDCSLIIEVSITWPSKTDTRCL